MTPQAPLGEIVDLDAVLPQPGDPAALPAPMILDPAARTSWLASSHDLLNGLDVTDESDSIPGELFDSLFNSGGH